MRWVLCFGYFLFSSCKSNLSCDNLKENYFSITENLRNRADSLRFLNDINSLLAFDSLCSKAYQVRGSFKLINKDFASARHDFQKAYSIDSFSVFSSYYIATLYNLEGKNDSAFYFLNKAIRLKHKGNIVIESNNYFTQKFDIPYEELIFFRGTIFYEEGLFQYAKKDFFESISSHHESGESYAYLAAIYSLANKSDSACFYYKKAISAGQVVQLDSSLSLKCK